MRKTVLFIIALSGLFAAHGQRMQVVHNEAAGKVDVTVNGMAFTSYVYRSDLEKPFLFPLHNSNGTSMTRGFPLNPIYGERVDHPQHAGVWFAFGNVNGLDFWNNYSGVEADRKPQFGTIIHSGISEMRGGENDAVLAVTADWNDSEGKTLLKSETRYVFGSEGHFYTIEHTIKLTAQSDPVVFTDSKEGLFAVRLEKVFEEVSDESVMRVGSDIPHVNNDDVNGTYRNSLGLEKEAGTWGKRADWVIASANKEGDDTSIAIMDHRSNPGYPAHWHTRGYGLFTANNMGSRQFSASDPEFSLTLAPGQSVTFRHKIVIKAGSYATDEDLNLEFGKFNNQ